MDGFPHIPDVYVYDADNNAEPYWRTTVLLFWIVYVHSVISFVCLNHYFSLLTCATYICN